MKTLCLLAAAGLTSGLLFAQSSTGSQTALSTGSLVASPEGNPGPICPNPPNVRLPIDATGVNLPGALLTGNLPFVGNDDFTIKLDDPANLCAITPGAETWLLVAEEPMVRISIPNGGCGAGVNGLLVVDVTSPSFHLSGPVVWGGPGSPACHSLVIQPDSSLCNIRCVAQGLFIDPDGPSGPFVLTDPLRFILGS